MTDNDVPQEIPANTWVLVHIKEPTPPDGVQTVGYMPLFELSDDAFDAIINAVFDDEPRSTRTSDNHKDTP